MPLKRGGSLTLIVVLVFLAGPGWSQSASLPLRVSLTAAQIVELVQDHNQSRAEGLRHFKALRHYKVEYQGFSTKILATMEVEVTFDADSGKRLRVVSQSGSKFLCDKVLRRAVDSELEAAEDKGATALTSANYRFELAGSESLDGRPAYILDVTPLTESKFLYRGKIWVDAEDFAVVKIEAEPAKNPSIWISRTRILFRSAKTGDFWLPQENRSETKVRIGGTAVLTINYGTYQINSSAPLFRGADSARTQ